jgi:hypothetical protein
MKLITPFAVLRITIFIVLLLGVTMMGISFLTSMPGKSHRGPLPSLTQEQAELSTVLRLSVETLAGNIGERNYIYLRNLNAAADFIEQSLTRTGLRVQRHPYRVDGKTYYNIEAEKKGRGDAGRIYIVGAHYDSVPGSPGANDNASGIAALLWFARGLAEKQAMSTMRFVAFSNEEPPFFWTQNMGSYVYARLCKERGENIVGMISLETIGCYYEKEGTQHYMFPLGLFYPSQGNFIAFVSNLSSRKLLKETVSAFRRNTAFPSEGGSFPWLTPGVFWSDHWPFWKMGYPALMVTDTALFRYPYYHTGEDTPDKLDYDRLARVVTGLEKMIGELAGVQGTE